MKKMMTKAAWRVVSKTARYIFFSSALLLAGCMTHKSANVLQAKPETALSETKLADYQNVNCDALWQMQGQVAEENPLYWLRAIECARGLIPADARMLAHSWDEETWQAAFRQSILLAKAKITPQERRRYVMRLDNVSYAVPDPIRQLYQLWRDGQMNELELAQARGRYTLLQQNTDRELDGLREQEKHLRAQLEQTTRQLQNLTDIERQLSSRKSTGGYFAPEKSEQTDDKDEQALPDNHNTDSVEQQPEEAKP